MAFLVLPLMVATALFGLQVQLATPPELLSAAFAALEAGDSVTAERHFRDILTDYPGETQAYRGLALAYVRQGRARDALTVLVQVGSRMQQAGSSEQARPLLELAVELAPEMPAARYFLGAALADTNQPASAATHFQRALDAGDTQLATRVSLAAALWEAGQVEAAEAHYREALEVSGRNPIVLHQFATLLLFLGRPEEAAALLAEAVAAGDPGPYLLLDQARALEGAGEIAAAVESARQAVERAPGLSQAHYQLGTLLVRSGDREGAAAAFARVRSLSTADAESQREIFRAQAKIDEARAEFLAGDPEACLATLRDLPGSAGVLELRAAALSALGQHERAAGALQALLEIEPGRRDVEAWLVRERGTGR